MSKDIDIFDKLKKGEYKFEYKHRIDVLTCTGCDNSYHLKIKYGDIRDIPEYCSYCGTKIGDDIRNALEENKVRVVENRKKEGEMYNQFKKDALEYVGLTDHPKADKIYAYAWEKGHSAGYHEVLNCLVDLYETIFKD